MGQRMDECSSLLQCGVWLLDRWGAREGHVLDGARHRRSDGDRLVSNLEIKAILVPCNAANVSRFSHKRVYRDQSGGITSGLPVIPSEWQIRGDFPTQAIARAGPSHNYHVELLYQRRTRRARSVFQRLALPTPVSISNGICSG